MDARPWDFQADECALRACVDKFNTRRYATHPPTNTSDSTEQGPIQTPNKEVDMFLPVDNCLHSILSEDIVLSDDFKENYEMWLEAEVFNTEIDWTQILVR